MNYSDLYLELKGDTVLELYKLLKKNEMLLTENLVPLIGKIDDQLFRFCSLEDMDRINRGV